ncbi:hypothetical protein [Streptomyces sp. GC420]|uniref:hypothetical protein n=1 Tax=Streptomyces sp. GC420 TaxID=2697568 RepID=UPI001414EAB6|nr:hypothetical protein [Streptomyces sp. GC420]NBM17072.1 hypothetical protein [Streptomyces sp. GC420]
MNEPARGYWCECWTQQLADEDQPTRLTAIDAYTPAQAVRWIAVALRTITSALEPAASAEAWDWLYEGRHHTAKALRQSEPCHISITTAGTRITWTARPVLFLPVAHHRGSNSPACTKQFRPRTAD